MLTRPSSRALVACGLGVEMNGGTSVLGNEWRTCNTSSSVMNANTSSMWHAHARPSLQHGYNTDTTRILASSALRYTALKISCISASGPAEDLFLSVGSVGIDDSDGSHWRNQACSCSGSRDASISANVALVTQLFLLLLCVRSSCFRRVDDGHRHCFSQLGQVQRVLIGQHDESGV